MAKKKSRKSRKSLGREGSPRKARTSVGMRRLLNQLEAHRKGKRTMISLEGAKKVPGTEVFRKVV